MPNECGCKEVYRFPLINPTPLVSALFAAASLLFVHFFILYIRHTVSFPTSATLSHYTPTNRRHPCR